ncbi:hypothetical protein Tco_0984130 [Tanacetum coccineum]
MVNARSLPHVHIHPKDSARIWWNGQKTSSILNYEDLKDKLWSYFNFGSTRREAYIWFCPWFEDKKLSRASLHRPPDHLQRPRKSSWDNNRGQKGRDRFSPYQGPNHGLLSNLSKIPREILATE